MAEADVDGRMAQWLADQMACLSMEIHESVAEGIAAVEALLPPKS